MAQTGYRYHSLNHANHEIRLLSLAYPSDEPETTSQAIFTLTHISLDADPAPVFTALSYVWGDPTNAIPISIDGHAVPVTQNLHSALTRLQRERFQGPIWIDAICINQSDTAEKNSQIPLMTRIYTGAIRVLAWLGPEEDHGALAYLEAIGAAYRHQGRVPGELGDRTGLHKLITDVLQDIMPTVGKTPRQTLELEVVQRVSGMTGVGLLLLATAALAQHAWWRRVWVVQELVLARRAVFFCGTEPGLFAPWDDLKAAMELLARIMFGLRDSPAHQQQHTILAGISMQANHLITLTDEYRSNLSVNPSGVRKDAGLPLLGALVTTATGRGYNPIRATGQVERVFGLLGIHATDPRDRIYGLLGIVREIDRVRIPVDYSPEMSLDKLLFGVGKVVLEDSGPDALCYSQVPPRPIVPDGLPSWIADWTSTTWIPLFEGFTQLVYPTSEKCETWTAPRGIRHIQLQDPGVTLGAVVVGHVTDVGQHCAPASCTRPRDPEALHGWILDIERMLQRREEANCCTDEGVRRDACVGVTPDEAWCIPVENTTDRQTPIGGQDECRFKRGYQALARRGLPASLAGDEAKQKWIDAVSLPYRSAMKSFDRRVFLSSRFGVASIGLGPENMAIGDAVVVFSGGSLPFVLRESTAKRGSHHLIGHAYIHGFVGKDIRWEESPAVDIRLV